MTGRGIAGVMLLWAVCCLTWATSLPGERAVPGGIAIVDLGALEDTPRAWFATRRVMVARHLDHWYAIVGIPIGYPPGPAALEFEAGDAQRKVGFSVGPYAYAEQRLRIANRRLVNPDQGDLERIARERTIMDTAYARFTPGSPVSRFDLPADGPFSSPFGLRRVFNGESRNPHSGLDIAAPAGDPVRAPAAGEVVVTGNFFFNGNTVMIDHGNSLITMYCHLARIDVREGQHLARGDLIGLVGATGRATGPHLHWSVSLNQARVDPLLFVAPGTADAHPVGAP